jgi:hypothetical protein
MRKLNHTFPFRGFLVGLPGPSFFFPQSVVPVKTWGDLKGSLPSCFSELKPATSDLKLLFDLCNAEEGAVDLRFSAAVNFFPGEGAGLGSADLVQRRISSFWKSLFGSSMSCPCGFQCTPRLGGVPSDTLPLCRATTSTTTSSWDVHSSSGCEFR